jgi:hypothetical protein
MCISLEQVLYGHTVYADKTMNNKRN